jgi:hypothetical protein
MKAGPTGNFPQGKLNDDDEGELVIRVGIDQEKIVVHFGTEVAWFGMDVDHAEQFAKNIMDKVTKIRGTHS